MSLLTKNNLLSKQLDVNIYVSKIEESCRDLFEDGHGSRCTHIFM